MEGESISSMGRKLSILATLTVVGIYLCMDNVNNNNNTTGNKNNSGSKDNKTPPVKIKWKKKPLRDSRNPLNGFDDFLDHITNLAQEKVALCERMEDFIQTALKKYLVSNGWPENEFQNYRLWFTNKVHRPLLKYDVVGLNGNGELIVESRRTILVHQLKWEHLDAFTTRECFLEFEDAFLNAYDNPKGEEYYS